MKQFALIVVAVATLQFGCKPKVKPPSPVVPTPTATVQPSPTATATATPKPSEALSPPVKHVAPKVEPPASADALAKAIIQRINNEQEKRWWQGKIRPAWEIAVNKTVMLYDRTKQRYKVVQDQRSNGVPAAVIFCLHYRESSNDFTCHLHEGSSLQHRTRYVPKGRLPTPDPPYRWEVSAEDAIYIVDRLQGDWSNIQWAFDKMEAYNGLGYKKRGVPSPYVK